MRIRGIKITYLLPILLFLQCTEQEDINDSLDSASEKIIDNWTEVEVLSQKYLAEKRFNDSIPCFRSDDHLTYQQKDSLLRHWSIHHKELGKIINHLIE